FLYELSEDVKQDLIIALDNIHHTFATDWGPPLLYRILQLLPENIHMILLARVAPVFTFSRIRSKQNMDQLDDRALAFNFKEACELLGEILPDPETVNKLLGWTQGWVGGLQIIRQALEADLALREQEIERIITQSEAEIFNYFADKVYQAKPADARALLLRSALPERVTPEILKEALGVAISTEKLHAMVRENIFLSRVSGESDTFIYHPLFQDFLRKQLESETTPEQRARMHNQLARHYAGKQDWAPALSPFFEAGDEVSAAEVLLAAER